MNINPKKKAKALLHCVTLASSVIRGGWDVDLGNLDDIFAGTRSEDIPTPEEFLASPTFQNLVRTLAKDTVDTLQELTKKE